MHNQPIKLIVILSVMLMLGVFNPAKHSAYAQGDAVLTYLSWHPSGQFLAGVEFNFNNGVQNVLILDRQYQVLSTIPVSSEKLLGRIVWNSNGTQLAFGTHEPYDNVEIFVFDVDTTVTPINVQLRRTLQQATTEVPIITWSPIDKDIIAATFWNDVRFWDISAGTLSSAMSDYEVDIKSGITAEIVWHPSGQWIATHNRFDTLTITDVSVNPPQNVVTWTIPDRDPLGLEWSPTGDQLALTDGSFSENRHNVFIFSWVGTTQTLVLERTLTNATRVQWLQWRGDHLLTMSEDRAIDIWNTTNWQLETIIERDSFPPELQWNGLSLSPDGTELAYISPEGNQIRPIGQARP